MSALKRSTTTVAAWQQPNFLSGASLAKLVDLYHIASRATRKNTVEKLPGPRERKDRPKWKIDRAC